MSEYVAYFRKDGRSKLGPQQELCENFAVVANEVENPSELYLTGKSILSGRNWGGDTLISGSISNAKMLPASLYLSEKPQFLDRWPLHEPK